MKAERMSLAAYKTTIRHSESPRQIERRILSRLTGALEAHCAFDTATTAADRLGTLSGGLRDALAENQKFWTELKYDLALPGNALSPDLRAGLVSLAIWVDRQTADIMGGKPGVRALAEINRSILAGLSATPAAEAPQPVAAAQPAYQGR
ncbi:MAG: flagellar biosynthesis regulator FlaF [Paracoccaceae bacterium]|nr:flagellar biosynthesis regulator FlaF [Paracoccaceae bacterium]